MNREIKFRQFLDGVFHYWGFTDNIFIAPATSSSGANPATTRHDQFTGIKDKNGKDIYFRDIINLEDVDEKTSIKGAIVTETVTGGTGILDQNSWITSEFWGDEDVFSLEVIGNVFENPELLLDDK